MHPPGTQTREENIFVDILQAVLDLRKKVTLMADVVFVNGIAFFVSTPRQIKFTMLE